MFLDILAPFLDKKFIQNTIEIIEVFFPLKEFTKKNSAQNSNFQQKWCLRHLVAKQSQKDLTCGQLRNTQRYEKYVLLVRWFFLEFHTCSSQQCLRNKLLLQKMLSDIRVFTTYKNFFDKIHLNDFMAFARLKYQLHAPT